MQLWPLLTSLLLLSCFSTRLLSSAGSTTDCIPALISAAVVLVHEISISQLSQRILLLPSPSHSYLPFCHLQEAGVKWRTERHNRNRKLKTEFSQQTVISHFCFKRHVSSGCLCLREGRQVMEENKFSVFSINICYSFSHCEARTRWEPHKTHACEHYSIRVLLQQHSAKHLPYFHMDVVFLRNDVVFSVAITNISWRTSYWSVNVSAPCYLTS